MYKVEIHSSINKIVQTFYRFGIWRNEDESSVIRKVGWKLSYVILQVCYFLSVILGGLFSDDKNESVYLIAVGITDLVLMIKLTYLLWKKEEILAFIFEIGTHFVAESEEFTKVNEKVKGFMKFSSSFIWLTYGVIGALLIFTLPLFQTKKILPLNIWFPLDWKNNAIAYWIAYAFLSIGTIVGAVTILFNVIIWYLMVNCSIKYQILGKQFRNIAKTNPTIEKAKTKKRKISEEEKQKLFLEELIGLINTHHHIKETIDRFKSCFANLFFVQITTSGICICGAVYVLSFNDLQESLLQTVTYTFCLLYYTFDIFMIMYFLDEIKLSSNRLSYCLFELNWIEQSKSCKKCIIILTEVLIQPHELVIGVLYPISLETFTSILHLAYSMFNILKNFD